MRSLQGAVVAITGASAGIGRECALAFAREGARVAVCARRADRLEAVAEAVRTMGGEAWVMAADVGDPEQVRRFVQGAASRFGRLDVLVNNAGYGVRGRVEDTPLESYRRLMEVNYIGTVAGCQAALPIMRRQKSGGVIINVSSIVGHRALPTGGAYAATKAAQISLTEALRAELKGSGVFACSVHPIGTTTEFGEVADRESGTKSPGGPVGPQQSALDVARAIVGCAKRPRPEVYPYPASRVLVGLNALAPGFVDWWVSRAARKAGRV
jgi:NADP-dependent 3-hydroxy acid dehydrogenase YdfG